MPIPRCSDVFPLFVIFMAGAIALLYPLARICFNQAKRERTISAWIKSILAILFLVAAVVQLSIPMYNAAVIFDVNTDEIESLTITQLNGKQLGRDAVVISEPEKVADFVRSLENAKATEIGSEVLLDGFMVEVVLDDGSVLYYSIYKNTSRRKNVYLVIPHTDKLYSNSFPSQTGAYICKKTYDWIVPVHH